MRPNNRKWFREEWTFTWKSNNSLTFEITLFLWRNSISWFSNHFPFLEIINLNTIDIFLSFENYFFLLVFVRLNLRNYNFLVEFLIWWWISIFIISHFYKFAIWIEFFENLYFQVLVFVILFFASAVIFLKSQEKVSPYLEIIFRKKMNFFLRRSTKWILHSITVSKLQITVNW